LKKNTIFVSKQQDMVIERVANEFVIRIPATGDINEVQDFLNYLRYRELTAKFSVPQSVVEDLVTEVKKNWRERRKKQQ
jgi:hypothetical protein